MLVFRMNKDVRMALQDIEIECKLLISRPDSKTHNLTSFEVNEMYLPQECWVKTRKHKESQIFH